MAICSADRWTCPEPTCRHTVVIDGPPDDVAVAIRAVQEWHGKAHERARRLEAKLRRLPVTGPRRMTA